MEFGALQCVPKSPNCSICPLQNECFAFNNNLVFQLPKRAKKLKIKKRFFDFLIITQNDKLFIQKRKKGIWKGLYQFPLIEHEEVKSERIIKTSDTWRNMFEGATTTITKISPQIKHQLTHQTIYARFWHIDANILLPKNTDCIRKEELIQYPIPKLLEKYLKNIGII